MNQAERALPPIMSLAAARYNYSINDLAPGDGGITVGRDFTLQPSIGPENPVPEEIDHREIAAGVSVMNEVQRLLASEPGEPLKPRSLDMIFLVEKDVGVERGCANDHLNHE